MRFWPCKRVGIASVRKSPLLDVVCILPTVVCEIAAEEKTEMGDLAVVQLHGATEWEETRYC